MALVSDSICLGRRAISSRVLHELVFGAAEVNRDRPIAMFRYALCALSQLMVMRGAAAYQVLCRTRRITHTGDEAGVKVLPIPREEVEETNHARPNHRTGSILAPECRGRSLLTEHARRHAKGKRES